MREVHVIQKLPVLSSALTGPVAWISCGVSEDSMSTLTSSDVTLDVAWPFRASLLTGSSAEKVYRRWHQLLFTRILVFRWKQTRVVLLLQLGSIWMLNTGSFCCLMFIFKSPNVWEAVRNQTDLDQGWELPFWWAPPSFAWWRFSSLGLKMKKH